MDKTYGFRMLLNSKWGHVTNPFSVANEEIKKIKANYHDFNAQGIALHLFSEIPLLLFSHPPNEFCNVT
jgi:hypothetical protein